MSYISNLNPDSITLHAIQHNETIYSLQIQIVVIRVGATVVLLIFTLRSFGFIIIHITLSGFFLLTRGVFTNANTRTTEYIRNPRIAIRQDGTAGVWFAYVLCV